MAGQHGRGYTSALIFQKKAEDVFEHLRRNSMRATLRGGKVEISHGGLLILLEVVRGSVTTMSEVL
ncbi:hypothetical protein K474DRAFT_1666335 [Panus rudis PR-1116 ss-1]|nr:hypothetical protein K474DRAFT_1666335 [Panus rudis PR-1116 ss-1]